MLRIGVALATGGSFDMTDIWDRPVEVTIDCGDHFKTVHNSREALEALMTCWPERKCGSYSVARKSCLSSLRGFTPNEVAAHAFEIAAREAGILRS